MPLGSNVALAQVIPLRRSSTCAFNQSINQPITELKYKSVMIWIIRFVTSGHSEAITRIRRPTQKTPWLALTSCRSPCSAPRNWLIRDQSHNAMACHPMRRLFPFTSHC